MRRFVRSAPGYWGLTALLLVVTVRTVSHSAALTSPRHLVVTARAVRGGAVLTRADVALVEVPSAAAPVDGVRDVSAVVGLAAARDLGAHEVLGASALADRARHGMRARLTAGTRGVSLPHPPGALPLSVGDRVDVLTVSTRGEVTGAPDAPARVVAADAEVIDVSDAQVTVAVRTADVAGVAAAVATASVLVALR